MRSGFSRLRIAVVSLAAVAVLLAAGGALAWHPALSLYLTARAGVLDEAGDLDGAEQSYLMALGHDPDRVRAHTGLGVVYRKMGRCREAARLYRRALELDPSQADALSSLGVLHLLWKDYEAAIPLLERAVALAPESDVPMANLAIGYHYAGRTADGDRAAARAAQLGYPNMEALDAIFRDEMTIHTARACAADREPVAGLR